MMINTFFVSLLAIFLPCLRKYPSPLPLIFDGDYYLVVEFCEYLIYLDIIPLSSVKYESILWHSIDCYWTLASFMLSYSLSGSNKSVLNLSVSLVPILFTLVFVAHELISRRHHWCQSHGNCYHWFPTVYLCTSLILRSFIHLM